jgi:hypothetical protein
MIFYCIEIFFTGDAIYSEGEPMQASHFTIASLPDKYRDDAIAEQRTER